MDAIIVGQLEEKLFRRRQEILVVLEHLERQSQDLTGNHHFDWLDQAWDESAANTVDHLMELYRAELESIKRALGRIESIAFGSCLACHRPIESSRLDLFPQTEFCRKCREFRESFEAAA
ncbi:MAG TPA: TraR/DksA C4-type zinc finger protein [Candidatus Binatia bacterium]|jgi:RNA polymerase-binding transcription factor DksA